MALRAISGLIEESTPNSYRNLRIAKGSEFIDREGTDMTHTLQSGGGIQRGSTKIASKGGNYDIQLFPLISEESFSVQSVTDGIITSELTYTINEDDEYELTNTIEFSIEFVEKEKKGQEIEVQK